MFAAPLSVGITSNGEIVDVFTEDDLTAEQFESADSTFAATPVLSCFTWWRRPAEGRPLMTQVTSAQYRIDIEADDNEEQAIEKLTAAYVRGLRLPISAPERGSPGRRTSDRW